MNLNAPKYDFIILTAHLRWLDFKLRFYIPLQEAALRALL
jgi:hypothetical protein